MTASKWQAIRERFEFSGLSQVAFCNRERISAASFSYPRNEEADLVVELPLGVRLRFRVQACA